MTTAAKRSKRAPATSTGKESPAEPKITVARRITGDSSASISFGTVVAPSSAEDFWRTLSLDAGEVDFLSVNDLMKVMPDISPELSKALWDALRMCNPGWEYKVLKLDSDDEDEAAKVVVDEFIYLLDSLYGIDVVLNKGFAGAYVKGAFFVELVLGTGYIATDLAFPDPTSARFRPMKDANRGIVWELGQVVGGNFTPLNFPTIRYVPVDPIPGGAPYGRPVFAPALFACLFLLTLLHDLRRVIVNAGYSHPDFSVKTEILRQYMPEDIQGDPAQVQRWTNKVLDDLSSAYGNVRPQDAFMHTDVVELGRTQGALSVDVSGAAALIERVERMAVRALKTMPIASAITDGVSEANANRQWEMMVAGVKSMQHLYENLLSQLLRTMLRARGIQAKVEWRFAELRASEMMRDAQTRQLVLENALRAYLFGFTSFEQAGLEATGKLPEASEPLLIPRQFVTMGSDSPGGGDEGKEGTGEETGDGGSEETESNPDNDPPATPKMEAAAVVRVAEAMLRSVRRNGEKELATHVNARL